MFGMGGTELLVLFVIILLIFGPSQIPKMARGVGQAMREFRKAQHELNSEISREDPAPKPPENKPLS